MGEPGQDREDRIAVHNSRIKRAIDKVSGLNS
jgi:hypothetical protein